MNSDAQVVCVCKFSINDSTDGALIILPPVNLPEADLPGILEGTEEVIKEAEYVHFKF